MQLPQFIFMRLPARLRLWMHWGRLRRRLEAAKEDGTFPSKRIELEHYEYELIDWEQAISDSALEKKARKLEIYFWEFPVPPERNEQDMGHWYTGPFGSRLLRSETRNALKTRILERAALARREGREDAALIIQAASMLTALGGVAVAILALLFKD